MLSNTENWYLFLGRAERFATNGKSPLLVRVYESAIIAVLSFTGPSSLGRNCL